MKKINYKVLIAIVVVLGIIIFSLRNFREEKLNSILYKTMIITQNNGKGYIEVNGNVEVNDTKKVFVNKKLKVKDVYVQQGDYVEKGQLLMTFDEAERNNILRKLEREKLNLQRLKRNYKVEKELNKIGGSSLNSVEELRENMRQSEINVEEYMEDLSKTAEKVISPVSGTIATLTAQENYLVDTDTPLMEIADLSNIKIVLEVPEYDVQNIYLGQKLTLKPEVFERKKKFTGKITKISKISEVSKTTSENVVKVEVKPDETIPYIIPGFKVIAVIYLDNNRKDNTTTIPKTAILENNRVYSVFVVGTDGTINKRVVSIVNIPGDDVVVKSGLNVGEKILLTPDFNLKDGDKIKMK